MDDKKMITILDELLGFAFVIENYLGKEKLPKAKKCAERLFDRMADIKAKLREPKKETTMKTRSNVRIYRYKQDAEIDAKTLGGECLVVPYNDGDYSGHAIACKMKSEVSDDYIINVFLENGSWMFWAHESFWAYSHLLNKQETEKNPDSGGYEALTLLKLKASCERTAKKIHQLSRRFKVNSEPEESYEAAQHLDMVVRALYTASYHLGEADFLLVKKDLEHAMKMIKLHSDPE